MRKVTVSAIQMQCSTDVSESIQTADRLVRKSASDDLDSIYQARLGWGVFRDRRPDCYGIISGNKNK